MITPPASPRSTSTSRVLRLTVLATALFMAPLAACSSGDDDTSADTTTTTEVSEEQNPDEQNGDEGDDEDDVTTTTTSPTTTTTDAGPSVDPDRELTDFERDYAAELASGMGESLGLPASIDTTCLGTAWVGAIGGDRLEAAGLDAETFLDEGPGALGLDRDTAVAMHRGGLDCGLTADVLVKNILPMPAECPDAAISDDDFEAIMVAAYIDEVDDQLEQRLEKIQEACGRG